MFQTILHILCIISSILCFVSLVLNIFFKRFNLLKTINSSIYTLSLGLYLMIFEVLKNYLENYYGLFYEYHYIILISTLFITIIGVLLVIFGLFIKQEKFNKYAYNVYELFVLVLNIALVVNLFTSKVSSYSIVLLPIIILNIIFTEQFIINYTENLETTFSKYLYFIINSVISVFWIICFVTLILKTSFVINGVFVILTLIVLILSSSSIVFGILRLRKGK